MRWLKTDVAVCFVAAAGGAYPVGLRLSDFRVETR